jgi:hypothetical protein
MSSLALSQRANWELAANQGGAKLEDTVHAILSSELASRFPDTYTVTKHPATLRQLYYENDYIQNKDAYAKPAEPTVTDVWYDATTKTFMALRYGREVFADGGGCIPDIEIRNNSTGKSYFIECKNQNDAGNAHERCAKYATPSVIRAIQEKIGAAYHPIGYLFSGTLVNKRKYVIELELTYGFVRDHLLLWKVDRATEPLLLWLNRVILPLIA